MKLNLLLTAAALFAAPVIAHAQTSTPAPDQPSAASAAQAGVNASAESNAAAPLGSSANPIPQSSPTPADQAGALTSNDPTVVSNGPVPDTPANRAKYGKPMSHAGRLTQPAGN